MFDDSDLQRRAWVMLVCPALLVMDYLCACGSVDCKRLEYSSAAVRHSVSNRILPDGRYILFEYPQWFRCLTLAHSTDQGAGSQLLALMKCA